VQLADPLLFRDFVRNPLYAAEAFCTEHRELYCSYLDDLVLGTKRLDIFRVDDLNP
jgi:hypothetical protein